MREGPLCSPEWSTKAGATFSDPDDDILALPRDALTLSLALVRDALSLCLRPPPTPDPLQRRSWELGMVDLVRGPTGQRCAAVEQDRVGGGVDTRGDSPSPERAPSSSLLPRTTSASKTQRPSPPQVSRTRGELVGPESETGVIRAPTPPHETHGRPKGPEMAPVGEPPGLARDGPR